MDFVKSTDFGSFQNISGRITGTEGREYVGYGNSISIDLPQGTYEVAWLNPKTGDTKEESPVSGGGTQTFNSPGGDQVLHVRNADTTPIRPNAKRNRSVPNVTATSGKSVHLQTAGVYAPDGRFLGTARFLDGRQLHWNVPHRNNASIYLIRFADGSIERNAVLPPVD